MFATHAIPGVMSGSHYDDEVARDLVVVVQIESRSGLENIEAICNVDGVDIIFIGKPRHKTSSRQPLEPQGRTKSDQVL